ncbi:MAG: GumC family protein [Methylovirgula sp.]
MSEPFEPNVSFDERTSEIDLGALGRGFARKRRWIIWPTVMALIAMGIFVNVIKPTYTAESQVLLENQESYLPRQQQAEIPSDNLDEQSVGSQIQLVTSRDIARRVIERLGLIGNLEFDPGAEHLDAISRVAVLFGLMRDPTSVPPMDRTVDNLIQHLTVFSPTKTRVLTVQYQAHDPKMAARIANEIVALYLEAQSDAKRQRAKGAAAALTTQITELRGKLAEAADAVERYRTTTGLLAGTNNMTISGQQLADLNTDLSKARTDEADAQAKAALIREMLRTGRTSDVADVANNDLVRRIAEQVVTARAQLALESRTLLPEHPRIKELNAQIADLEGQLRAAVQKTARTLENNAKIAASRVANLEAALTQQKTSAARSNVDEVHLHELERNAQALRDQLAASLAKYQEAVARETSQATPSDARVINRAVPPDQPSFPKKVPMLIFGTVAALVLSSAAVIGSELLAGSPTGPAPAGPVDRPRPVDDPKPPKTPNKQLLDRLREFGRSAAATRREPSLAPAPATVSSASASPPPPAPGSAAEAQPASAVPVDGARIVATSVIANAAAANALLGFARSLAKDGRPILIDLDAKDGDLAGLLTADDDVSAKDAGKYLGLTDLLTGAASFAEVIHRDPGSRLHFIAFGSPAEFDSTALDMVLDALAQTYDFIVLAAPALGSSELAKSLASYGDFVVLINAGEAKDKTNRARDVLLKAGAAEVMLIGAAGKATQTRNVA